MWVDDPSVVDGSQAKPLQLEFKIQRHTTAHSLPQWVHAHPHNGQRLYSPTELPLYSAEINSDSDWRPLLLRRDIDVGAGASYDGVSTAALFRKGVNVIDVSFCCHERAPELKELRLKKLSCRRDDEVIPRVWESFLSSGGGLAQSTS